jgi:hypothetical protein
MTSGHMDRKEALPPKFKKRKIIACLLQDFANSLSEQVFSHEKDFHVTATEYGSGNFTVSWG